jgi:hypothetical protein|tara:strand:+ start:3951 stop:4469 length:519 start_codon:yes stop_codon:yes gene_type:complete
MANESVGVFKFGMKFGLVGAAVTVALTLLLFVLDMSESSIGQYANYAVILGIILWGQIAYRKAESLAIGYGETFGLAVLIVCYYAAVVAVYTMIHWTVIDVEIATRVKEVAEAALLAQGLPEDQLEAARQIQQLFIGPIATPVMGFIVTLFIGIILSLITSIFTRRANAVSS